MYITQLYSTVRERCDCSRLFYQGSVSPLQLVSSASSLFSSPSSYLQELILECVLIYLVFLIFDTLLYVITLYDNKMNQTQNWAKTKTKVLHYIG